MLQNIGKMEIQTVENKSNNEVKTYYILVIAIPGFSDMHLTGVPNTEKRGPGSADVRLFYKGAQVGGLWKKYNTKQSPFYSGNTFFLGFDRHQLSLLIFPIKDEHKKSKDLDKDLWSISLPIDIPDNQNPADNLPPAA